MASAEYFRLFFLNNQTKTPSNLDFTLLSQLSDKCEPFHSWLRDSIYFHPLHIKIFISTTLFSIKIFALTCNLLQVPFYGRKFLVRFMTQYDYEKHQRTNGIHSFYMNQIFFSAFMNDRIESCCFLYCSLKIQAHFQIILIKKKM